MPKISAAGGPSVAGEGNDRLQSVIERAAQEQGFVVEPDGRIHDPATGQRFDLNITANAEVERSDEQRRADESELAELPDDERSADERADDGFVLDTGDEINDSNEPKE